ncbi:MAG TPA: hypothetical protein VFY62_12270 [Pseudomonas sp.]|nr:hypothetical protein [Pseudomonas sp.]
MDESFEHLPVKGVTQIRKAGSSSSNEPHHQGEGDPPVDQDSFQGPARPAATPSPGESAKQLVRTSKVPAEPPHQESKTP